MFYDHYIIFLNYKSKRGGHGFTIPRPSLLKKRKENYIVQKKSLFIGEKQIKNDVKKNIKRGIIASELPDQQRRSGQVRQSLRQETTRNVTFRLSLKNNDKFGNISKVHGLEASALKNFTIGTESHQGKIKCGAFSEPDFIPNCFL